MGTGGSVMRNQEDEDTIDVECDGVVRRIPVEIPKHPHGRKFNLPRSVSSFARKSKSGSLKSALSVDIENAEVEKIHKEYEMYRLNKENEIQNMKRKELKLEKEVRRLRNELQTLQRVNNNLRQERDAALEAEQHGLIRASTFEGDRDKIQRNFKLFRETKENEIQSLLRTRRDLESKLGKLSKRLVDDNGSVEMISEVPYSNGNPGDWWTALESEPSLGSTTQLQTLGFRGPELASCSLDMDGPFIDVNKNDWVMAAAGLANTVSNNAEALQTNIVNIYVIAPHDTSAQVKLFKKQYKNKLSQLCGSEGRILTITYMPCDAKQQNPEASELISRSRQKCVEATNIVLGFFSRKLDQSSELDCNVGHLDHPGSKSAIFIFTNPEHSKVGKKRSSALDELLGRIKESGHVTLHENCQSFEEGVELAAQEVESVIKLDLGIDQRKDISDATLDQEEPEALCGGSLWDPRYDHEQLESLVFALKSTCELGFEKYYDQLHNMIHRPGPLPPLLIMGGNGSGKSLLLAKWIDLQQHRNGRGLVLYHFVGSCSSSSAGPLSMIRRLTAQLMQHVTSPPSLACDPERLIQEFPRWLDKISQKIPGGIILVLDSIDRFEQVETMLPWLLDPLPVECRVIVSVNKETCPASWRLWPTLDIEEFSIKTAKELLRADLASLDCTITEEQESQIMMHLRGPGSCLPLFITVLAREIASCHSEQEVTALLKNHLKQENCIELYKSVMLRLSKLFETEKTAGQCAQIFKLIYASRNGLSEAELFELIPKLSWNLWAPFFNSLKDRRVLTSRSGLVVFAHENTRTAVWELYFTTSETAETLLEESRKQLVKYFVQFQQPNEVTHRVADELPWLYLKTHQKQGVKETMSNLCVFLKLYGRGNCQEILKYWSYAEVDKESLSHIYLSSLRSMEKIAGSNPVVTLPRLADVYEALGCFLRDLGMLTDALTSLQRALEIRETSLDPDHPSVAQTLHQMAGLYAQQSKFSTAEALYKHSLQIYEDAFGKDHFFVAKELDALAVLLQKQGKHQMAEPLHRQALNIRSKAETVRPNSSTGRVTDPLKKRTLQLEDMAMGPDSPDLARVLNELGVLYYLQNITNVAEKFFKRSLQMRKTVLSADHPDLAQSLNNLAALYNDRKRYEEAAPLYEKALEIRRKHYPHENPSVTSIINHLAQLYKKMKLFKKAEPLYKESLVIRETCFDSNHPAVATALVNLAVIHSEQGEYSKAEPLYQQALAIYQESFGSNHPRVAETLRNMALLNYHQGEFEEAAQLYKKATEIRENDMHFATKATPSRRSSLVLDTLPITKVVPLPDIEFS